MVRGTRQPLGPQTLAPVAAAAAACCLLLLAAACCCLLLLLLRLWMNRIARECERHTMRERERHQHIGTQKTRRGWPRQNPSLTFPHGGK